MSEITTLFLKLPRESEVTPEAAQTFLAALTQINSVSSWDRLMGTRPQALALEIYLLEHRIRFAVSCDSELVPFVEAQLQSNYSLAIIEKVVDPIASFPSLYISSLTTRKGNYHPISTYSSFSDIDPLSSPLSVLSKVDDGGPTIIQYCLSSISGSWQSRGQKMIERGIKNPDGTFSSLPDESLIKEKISYPGMGVSIRIASTTKKTLNEISSSFGVFTRAESNGLGNKKIGLLSKKPSMAELVGRVVSDNQILNISELATIWHLPSAKVQIPSIVWSASVLSDPPYNLPVSTDLTDEEKNVVNFFGKTHYKNRETIFGIKDSDRMRHIWTIGKTGTGKSTLIANMAIDDLKKGRGVCVIDPHGDLVETLLDYVPKSRINETILFNPADREHPITINPLEVTNREEAELVVAGLMAIFTKVWANVWSARMEYILRNSFMSLAEMPNTTLADVLMILSNKSFRDRVVNQLSDPSLKQFWRDEYEKMPDRLQKEAISPIQNKVGQFVTSPMIRRVIGSPKSSIAIDDIMNSGKILLCNLSQGRLGEDNSSLLGAMMITKIQQAAMRRVDMPESARAPFYLYVDEFQNFATTSFIKILSEARKYKLALSVANQYITQIPEEVQKAILGNAGTIVSFAVGAEDASIVHKEFSEVFSEKDLVDLANFQIAVRLMIEGRSARPFLAHTLPLPASKNQNREKVIRTSQERWGQKTQPTPPPTPNEQQNQPREQGGNFRPRPYQQPQRKPHFDRRPPQRFQPRHQNQNVTQRENKSHETQGSVLIERKEG